MKSRKGFTLVEMVISVAIILIITAAMSVSVSTYMDRTKQAADIVNEHDARFSEAREDVDNLKRLPGSGSAPGSAPSVSSPAGGTTTTQPAGGTTTTQPAQTTTQPTQTTTRPTQTTTQPTQTTTQPTTTSTQPAPSSDAKVNIGNYSVPAATSQPAWVPGAGFQSGQPSQGWGKYEYNVIFNLPQSTVTTYAAIYLPEGAPDIKEWYNCNVLAYDPVLHIAVVSIPPYISAPAIRVDYPGEQENWKQTTIYYQSTTPPTTK